jgi:hypothetical protein
MSPILIVSVLIWSICLLIIGISAALYAYAEKVQDEIELLSMPESVRRMGRAGLKTRHATKALSHRYLREVSVLFSNPLRSKKNGEE